MKYLFLILSSLVAIYCYFNDNYPKYVRKEPKKWMYEQITEDLAYYNQKGITKEMFLLAERAIKNNDLPLISIITIQGGKVTSFPEKKSKRVRMIVAKMQDLINQGGQVKDTKFLIGESDAWNMLNIVPAKIRDQIPPIFVFARNKLDEYKNRYILFPDDHTLGNHIMGYRRGWHKIAKEILNSQDKFLWEKKRNIAFWRGLDTDCEGYKDCLDSPRSKLVAVSNQYPEIVDAKFNHTDFANKFVIRTFRPFMQLFSIPPYISQEDQLKFKILINVDGKTATYPGLLWRLFSGSLVLKQQTENEQWFYRILIPWKHYVPVEFYFANILTRAKWIMSNDQLAKKIAQQGKELVEDNVMPEHIDAYIELLFQEYNKLL